MYSSMVNQFIQENARLLATDSSGNLYVEAIARASSNDERAALLDHYRRT